jgi:hypothetical protein
LASHFRSRPHAFANFELKFPDYASNVIPFLAADKVSAAVTPKQAVDAVREGFVA